MRATLTAEQVLVQRVASDWLSATTSDARWSAGADQAIVPCDMAVIAGCGWVGLLVPESKGGSGGSVMDAALLHEQCGRALHPDPLLSTSVVAGAVVAAGDDEKLLASVLRGERTLAIAIGSFDLDGDLVSGRADGVLAGPLATDILINTRDGLRVVERDAAGVTLVEMPTVDVTRSVGSLELLAASSRSVVERGAERAFQRCAATQLVLLAAESLGAGQHCLERAVEYAGSRQQFKRLIGSFQGVAFPLVDAFTALERARSLTYYAAWTLDEGDASAATLSAAAKVAADRAARLAAETAIQTLGGMGMTWDVHLHRWYKRALVNAHIGPDALTLRDQVASALMPADG